MSRQRWDRFSEVQQGQVRVAVLAVLKKYPASEFMAQETDHIPDRIVALIQQDHLLDPSLFVEVDEVWCAIKDLARDNLVIICGGDRSTGDLNKVSLVRH